MSIVHMKALKAFKDMEGDVKEGQQFMVNEERAFVLARTGRAVQTSAPPPVVESPAEPQSDAGRK